MSEPIRRPEWCSTPTYTVDDKYGVCIDAEAGRYAVYDLVTDADEAVEEKLRAAEAMIEEAIKGDKDIEEVIRRVDPSVRHIVLRHVLGYGRLEPLMHDPRVVNIHVVGAAPAQIVHQEYGRLTTNIRLGRDELRELSLRLGSVAGKRVSEATPIASFVEPRYEARVTLVYESDVSMRRFTAIDIRKQPKNPWSIIRLVDAGTLTHGEAAALWFAVKYKVPILIIGELMSGKTTLSTAVINLVPPGSRVMTIEDTPELKVAVTDYWIRTTTRDSPVNPVTVFDLLKIAMRISADYIVVGEVRGEEARYWAQGVLLGHGALTTFHADSPEAALLRLRNPPISIDEQVLRMVNMIVRMIPVNTGRGLARRAELYVYDSDGSLHQLYRYVGGVVEEVGRPITEYGFVERVMARFGATRRQLREEYRAMTEAVRGLHERLRREGRVDAPVEEVNRMLYSSIS